MKVICLGDSNTYGYDSRSFLGGRYEEPWPAALAERSGWQVISLAENGKEIPHNQWDNDYMIRRIRENLPADLIVVMLGSNDILNLHRNAVSETAVRMRAFLKLLKVHFSEPEFLLLAPSKILQYNGSIMPESQALAGVYENIAKELGIYFTNIDAWDLPLAYDGLHLAEEGHYLLAEELEDFIKDSGLYKVIEEKKA